MAEKPSGGGGGGGLDAYGKASVVRNVVELCLLPFYIMKWVASSVVSVLDK